MHVEKACTHVCKVPVCVCLWASRASSEENVAPHWSHTSASAGAVDKIKFKRVYFDQTWTQTCVCNCSLSQLISHLKRTVEKSNERGGQRDAVWKVSKEPCLSHTCAFQVLTQGSKCAEYNGAVESAVKTQLGTNKSTRQGAMALLLKKRKRKKKRAELKSFIYRALLSVSEQWADCMPERPQKDWVFSLQQTLPACGTSLYQKKHFRVNTPNPTAYTVTTVPSSPLECPCLFWWRHERDKYARCQQKRSILVLHSPHTCTDRQIRQICTYAHAHTLALSLTHSCLDVGWLSQRCKSVADPYWPRAHSLIYFLLSWL